MFSADAGDKQAVVKLSRTNTDYAKRDPTADHDWTMTRLELREGRKTVLGSLEHERKILKILNDAKAPGKMHDPCESAAWFWQMTLCS